MSLPSAIRAVTLELTQARLDVFDPRATVAFLAERGVNTVVCFAIGYGGGEAYYPSALAPEHPDLHGRDLFGEVCALAAERGLAVIAYVNSLFGGPEFYEPHPDWTQRWADGRESTQTGAKMLCPNSPYGEHIAAVAAEIAGRYPIAGFYLDEPSLQSWCACALLPGPLRRATPGSELPLSDRAGNPGVRPISELAGRDGYRVRRRRGGGACARRVRAPRSSRSTPSRWRRRRSRTCDSSSGERPSGRTPPQWEGWYRPSFYGQNIAAHRAVARSGRDRAVAPLCRTAGVVAGSLRLVRAIGRKWETGPAPDGVSRIFRGVWAGSPMPNWLSTAPTSSPTAAISGFRCTRRMTPTARDGTR